MDTELGYTISEMVSFRAEEVDPLEARQISICVKTSWPMLFKGMFHNIFVINIYVAAHE